MTSEPSGFLIFGIMVLLITCVVLSFAIVSRLARWGRGEVPLVPERVKEVVKSWQAAPSDIMSHAQDDVPQITPSSQRQTNPQTDRPPATPSLPRDVMLDIYRLLRAHNVPREKARPALKAAGIPLDNNLWTEAAPPEEELEYSTPIAGRATKATFHPDDPTLEYKPPPR